MSAKMMRQAGLAAALFAVAMSGAQAQVNMQFPTTPWNGYAPAVVQCGVLHNIDANTAGDTAIPISVPTVVGGGGSYFIEKIWLTHASVSLDTATAGVFTGAGGTGTTVVSDGALSTLTAAALNAAGSAFAPTIASATEAFNVKTLYFRIGTPQGAAATLTARVFCRPAFG